MYCDYFFRCVILYCGCFNLFCNVWVCACVRFLKCGCFGNMCTRIYCGFELFHICIFYSYCFVCTGVLISS